MTTDLNSELMQRLAVVKVKYDEAKRMYEDAKRSLEQLEQTVKGHGVNSLAELDEAIAKLESERNELSSKLARLVEAAEAIIAGKQLTHDQIELLNQIEAELEQARRSP